MKLRLKQRLVGAVVLVTLAVIFLPMLLDGPSHPASRVVLEPIPAAPGDDFVPRKITLPDVPVSAAADQTDEPAAPAAPVAPAETTPPPAPPAPTAPPPAPAAVTEGWVVQVGSFSKPDNAHALTDKLAGMGFPAFVDTVDGGNGQTVARVRIGPVADRSAAEALLARLRAEAQLEGILRQQP